MATLTSANAVFMLSIRSVFPSPQRLQGFSTDDAFAVEAFAPTEALMGVDGVLSAGFTPAPKVMSVSLQADSASVAVFDNWYAAMDVLKEAITADAIITLPATGRVYTCVRGFLTSYMPSPPARKILGPRAFGITWQSIVGAPGG